MKKLKQFIITWQKPLLVLSGLLIFSLYSIINYAHLAHGTRGTTLTTWVDRVAPFWPSWQYVYFSVYLFAFFPAIFLKDNLVFRRTFYSFFLLQFVAFVFFIFFPTEIQRPRVGSGDFVSWGITFNQFLDPPYNCFPSLHVGNSFMAAFGILAVDTPIGMIAMLWATLIAISTVVVGHHFFVDVLAGFAIAAMWYFLLVFPLRKRDVKKEDLHRSRWWILFPLALTAVGVFVAYLVYLTGYEPWRK